MATTHPPQRRAPDLKALMLVLVLCVIWGFQQVAMKAVTADIAPVMQLAIRFAGASVFFAVWVLVAEGRAAFGDGMLRSGLALGLLFSLEFILVGVALAHTTAAHTVVFMYAAPIFTALGLQFLPEERLTTGQWIGIGVAFVGIMIAFLGHGVRPLGELIKGDLLALFGAMAWGSSNVVLRRNRIGTASTAKTVLYQVATAAVLLYAYAAVTGQTHVVLSGHAILSLIYQTLVVAILSYVVWFWMLRHYLTSRLMLLSLLTPLVGVLFGVTLLGDPIEPHFGLGAVLVLVGILTVNARALLKQLT